MSPEPHDPMIFQPGDTFRSLIVSAFLGSGHCGQVYAVDHRFTHRRFAVKVSPVGARGSANTVTRAIAQARAVYDLEHPNIVRVHDLGCDGGLVWQIMELLDGKSLGQLVACYGRLSPIYAIDLVLQVAFGLQAAHEHGIIHRDVHPWNIQVTADGRVVLLDFSLAKVIPAGLATTRGRYGTGTAAYMGPDQLKGAPAAPGFDVYALGITLWEIWVGRHPFAAELESGPMAAMITRHLNDDPESLVTAAGLPACCDDVLRRATAKDPRSRYAGMWPFIQALQGLRRTLLADPAAPLAVRHPPAWERRHAIAPDRVESSRYTPPRSLPRPSPEPHVPSRRIVVPGGALPAATVPMPVVEPPPAPSAASAPRRAEPAPPTVRGRTRPGAPPARRWALVLAAWTLAGLGAFLATLAGWEASPPPATSAVAPRASVSSAQTDPRRPPAPRPKR